MTQDAPAAPIPALTALRRPSRWPHAFSLGATGSLLMALALPGEGPLADGIWPLALLAPVPWIWLALTWHGSLRALLLGAWLGGLVLWLWLTLWTWPVATVGAPMLAGLQACYPALTTLLIHRIAHCPHNARPATPPTSAVPRDRHTVALVLAPFIWVGIEHFRASVFLGGYAWGLLAHPLVDSGLAPLARVGGVALVSLVACAFAASLAGVLYRRTPLRAALSILILVLALPLGLLERTGPKPSTAQLLRAAVVQTNVPQSTKSNWTIDDEVRDYFRFEQLTAQAANAQPGQSPRPDLIVWPETMAPGITLEPDAVATLERDRVVFRLSGRVPELGDAEAVSAAEFARAILALQARLDIPMLVGEEGVDNLRTLPRDDGTIAFESDAEFNSVYLIERGAVSATRYDKIILTPFGETMPLISRWPWLESQLARLGPAGLEFRLAAGTRPTVFRVPTQSADARCVTPICFEITVPSLCRSLVFDRDHRRADAMINLTNDAWFGVFDSVRRQHVQIARWRSIELATPMVRAANTGISCVIDARGRVLASGIDGLPGATHTDGVLSADVPAPDPRPTPFARLGDVTGWTCLALTVALALAAIARSLHR